MSGGDVAVAVLERVRHWRATGVGGRVPAGRPLVVGVSGVQGAGKTTLTRALAKALRDDDNLVLVAMSLDDFYLPHAGLRAVAAAHPDNALLQQRGNAGTHDVALLVATLDRLRALPSTAAAAASDGEEEVGVPVFSKALHGGRGDRLPEAEWTRVRAPVDVVLLEGWMLGFEARGGSEEEDRAALAELHPGLPEVDALLAPYAAVTARLDAFVQLAVDSLAVVYGWRLQAEHALAAATGAACMSDAEVRTFVDRFMPAYHAYLPALEARPPCAPHTLRLVLTPDRRIR